MKENMSNTQTSAALPTVEETLATVREVKKRTHALRRHESGRTEHSVFVGKKYGSFNGRLAMMDAFKEAGI